MMNRVLVDTDVILDVALAREEFVVASSRVLAFLEKGKAVGFVSATCITNIYYFLKKRGGNTNARVFIANLLKYISVAAVNPSVIVSALKSEFVDFEDAVQNYAAIESQCDFIVTRNIEHYKKSEVSVLLPANLLNELE